MFRLAHFSDPHLHFAAPPPRLGERFSKRSLSRLSWSRGRRELQSPQVLAAAVADVRAYAPDHWLISGDITNFSLPGEFVAAGHWLASLGDPHNVSVVPGNHDALVPVPLTDGWGHWQPWMTGDDGRAAFPYLRVRGELALIGRCSWKRSRHCWPISAPGVWRAWWRCTIRRPMAWSRGARRSMTAPRCGQ